MRRIAPALVAVLVVAGCGSGSKAKIAHVAGTVKEAQFSTPAFAAAVNAIAQQVTADVASFRTSMKAQTEAASSVQYSNCVGGTSQLALRSHTQQQRRATFALRKACADLVQASRAARKHDTASAQAFATKALAEAQLAVAAIKHA
jgi:outer membrane murein-binding lipoprotein Lpp